MRPVLVVFFVGAAVGCASNLRNAMYSGPPQSYVEAFAKDEGISVDEARRRLTEMRRNPSPANPATAQVERQYREMHGSSASRRPSPR